jgi:putative membrane-bound lytic murein transglycosylase D
MNYYCDHNIPAMKTRVPIETDTVVVTRNINLAQIAGACKIDLEALTAMNPQYRTGTVPGYSAPCAIRMPLPTIDLFLQLGDSVYNYAAPDQFQRRDEVTPATTSSSDAWSESPARETRAERRARLRQEAAEREAQEVEQRATSKKSKKDKKSKSEKSGKKKKNKKERTKEVSIKSGDTLSEIAERNGTTVAKLRKINKIKGNSIRAGKKIRVK